MYTFPRPEHPDSRCASPALWRTAAAWLFLFMTVFCLGGCRRLLGSGVKGLDGAGLAPPGEDRLAVWTSFPEEVYLPLIQEFEERTGVWVQVEAGGSAALLARLADVGAADSCDLILGGDAESLELCRERFAVYDSSAESGISIPVSLRAAVLVYNPRLVRIHPPSGWDSLYDPTWKGKIAFPDPDVSGFARQALSVLHQIPADGTPDVLAALVSNLDGQLLPRSGDVIRQVANGNFYIGVAPEDEALLAVSHGYNIALVYPREGTCLLPDCMAIVAGSPHEDNARRFAQFVLETDAQRFLAESCARRPVRADVPFSYELLPDSASAARIPGDGEPTFLPYDAAGAGSFLPDTLKQWRGQCTEVSP